ncbi:hypothetical protein ZWY2020_033797 [Hordeum vulgare]|nr:hypothetical protein ZWY2020_033797 [Hordeum vulgare]
MIRAKAPCIAAAIVILTAGHRTTSPSIPWTKLVPELAVFSNRIPIAMTSPKAPKDKIFEKVINPYLTGVLQHPQSIEMLEGMLHIPDVEGPKKTGSMEARLEAMEQQVFKCQRMVEHGLNANHMMITEFTNKHKIDANDIGKHLSKLITSKPRSMTCRTKTVYMKRENAASWNSGLKMEQSEDTYSAQLQTP